MFWTNSGMEVTLDSLEVTMRNKVDVLAQPPPFVSKI